MSRARAKALRRVTLPARRTPFRAFVTGTDTGVGKTEVACALLSLLADSGQAPAPFKPYESGCEDLASPQDARALKAAARSADPLTWICPHRFRLPLAPGVASAREHRPASLARTLSAFRRFRGRALVAEGAGGLFVPVDRSRDVIDLIALLGLPVVLVARAGLGTLNHTALSLAALRARRLAVLAVVLSQGGAPFDPSMEDNAGWLRRRHRLPVLGPVPSLTDPEERRSAFRRALQPLL